MPVCTTNSILCRRLWRPHHANSRVSCASCAADPALESSMKSEAHPVPTWMPAAVHRQYLRAPRLQVLQPAAVERHVLLPHHRCALFAASACQLTPKTKTLSANREWLCTIWSRAPRTQQVHIKGCPAAPAAIPCHTSRSPPMLPADHSSCCATRDPHAPISGRVSNLQKVDCALADQATLELGLPPVALSWVQLPYFQKFQLGANGTRPALKVRPLLPAKLQACCSHPG